MKKQILLLASGLLLTVSTVMNATHKNHHTGHVAGYKHPVTTSTVKPKPKATGATTSSSSVKPKPKATGATTTKPTMTAKQKREQRKADRKAKTEATTKKAHWAGYKNKPTTGPQGGVVKPKYKTKTPAKGYKS